MAMKKKDGIVLLIKPLKYHCLLQKSVSVVCCFFFPFNCRLTNYPFLILLNLT